jgi:hypothetical protein
MTDGGAKKLWLDGLNIDLDTSLNSQLDHGNGLLILDYSGQPNSAASVRQMLSFNGWTPDGPPDNEPGIMSSTTKEEKNASSSIWRCGLFVAIGLYLQISCSEWVQVDAQELRYSSATLVRSRDRGNRLLGVGPSHGSRARSCAGGCGSAGRLRDVRQN